MAKEDDVLLPVTEDDLSMQPLVAVPVRVPEDEPVENEMDEFETEFDPKYREPFVGLLYLGYLKKTVTKYGHSFKISTPSLRERIEGGVLHKRYANTVSAEMAWAAIVVGLYLEEVDGHPLPEPIGPAVDTKVEDRFNWVLDNIKTDLINELFEECLILDATVADTLKELKNVVKISG